MRKSARWVALATALIGVGVLMPASPAYASGNCPAFNLYMNDGVPTPVCLVSGTPFQAENKAPWTTINKTPAYGWNPAACYQTFHRWLGFSGSGGSITIGFRIVEDTYGTCSGPQINWSFSGGFIRSFKNIYGVDETQPAGCNNGFGGIGMETYGTPLEAGPACRPPSVGPDWKGGYYTIYAWMHTVNNTDHAAASTHQVYYP